MNRIDPASMTAYAAVKTRYGLKAKQRTKLDSSPGYDEILDTTISALAGDWRSWPRVGVLLFEHGIIECPSCAGLVDEHCEHEATCRCSDCTERRENT